jgi:hypothetical protein
LVSHLESSRITSGHVNFTNQEINRRLALEASATGAYATLDLKDASDRVSLQLVRHLFRFTPGLLAALEATRTAETQLPTGEVITLSKYAPMGSALCFPVEALCFWAICVSAVSRRTRLRPPEVGKHVYVYGDDIIVKTEWADMCIQALESYHLMVNRSKSCISGFFRESCGLDAFRGVEVQPTRLKALWSGRHTDGSAYVSYIAFANHMAAKGYMNCSDYVWRALTRTYGKIPFGTSSSGFPCRVVPSAEIAERLNAPHFLTRWSRTLHRFEFRVLRTRVRKVTSVVDGWSRLMRGLLDPAVDRDPSVNVLPRSLRIKRGWAAV